MYFSVTGADTTGWVNPPKLIANIAYDGAIDPITYSDGTTGSVHQVNTYVLQDSVAAGVLYTALKYPGTAKYIGDCSHTTSGAAEESPTNAAYTTPSYGVRQYKITFSGHLAFTTSGAIQGATVTIKQGATILQAEIVNFNTAIGDVKIPFCVSALSTATPVSTVLGGFMTRAGSNNPTLTGKFLVEEYY